MTNLEEDRLIISNKQISLKTDKKDSNILINNCYSQQDIDQQMKRKFLNKPIHNISNTVSISNDNIFIKTGDLRDEKFQNK